MRVRTILVVGGVMLVFWGVSLSLIFYFLLGSFGRLQEYLTSERLKQAILQIDDIAAEKLQLVRDNAVWDEAYHFLQGTNPDFLQKNYAPEVDTTGLDTVMVLGADGHLAGSIAPRDGKNPSALPMGLDLPKLMKTSLFRGEENVGLIEVKDGVLLLAAHRVIPSNGKGPSQGWLVFGQYVNKRILERISHLAPGTELRSVSAVSAPTGRDSMAHGVISTQAFGDVVTMMPDCGDDDMICHSLLIFPSLSEGMQIVFQMEVRERVFRTAYVIWEKLIWCAVAGGLALVLIALVAVEALVLRPLTRLQNDITSITDSHNGSLRIPAKGAVEFKQMAQSVNQLLDSERLAIQTLNEQKTLLVSVLNAALEAVIAFQPIYGEDREILDLRIVVFNRSAEKALSQKAEDLIGKAFGEEFAGSRSEGLLSRLLRVIDKQTSERFEYRSSAYFGQRWFQISAAPWGRGVLMTFEEITERKAREDQLKETMEEVERFNRAMIGREERIVELKKEINLLNGRLGLEAPYLEAIDEA